MVRNVQFTVKGKDLIITVKHDERLGPSSTGKTTIVATTGGGVEIPGIPGVKANISIYTKEPK